MSGVLLHPTSLPGSPGIGAFGAGARRFVDFLERAGQRRWQILPLVPTGMGDSPYSSCSTFAGTPLLISADELVAEGLLEPSECPAAPHADPALADYQWAAQASSRMVATALARFRSRPSAGMQADYADFLKNTARWLDDYALFVALKTHQDGSPWYQWEQELRDREPQALTRWTAQLADEMEVVRFGQFLFFRQWGRLRAYANGKGVKIIGDLPIFVTLDSADVWAHRDLFKLDERGCPPVVAGVPPDYFSATGQLWGNPLYQWDAHRKRGFDWWIDRMAAVLGEVDIVRLDHFRGFAACWEVPADASDAIGGEWVPGPGMDLFDALATGLPSGSAGRLIAEDLGMITPDVHALRHRAGLPGMAVLQFAFDSGPENPHLPEHHAPDMVVYTGTHDNNTTLGWFRDAPQPVRDFACRYLHSDGAEIHWDLAAAAMGSVAETCLLPMQDVLGLDGSARFNRPGEAEGNWGWRMLQEQLDEAPAERLRSLCVHHGRCPG
ncbi:MAG: 4-alpha-glucanotransferase [Nitrospirota bacterium]|nr:4-alpha-glucanotransferase [Nitrospirota bacterium]